MARLATTVFCLCVLLAALPAGAQGPLLLSDSSFAFVEHVGPGGADPCGAGAVSTFGCEEVGGNLVYRSLNGTGEYLMNCIPGADGTCGPEDSIAPFAPNDFELRWTAEGSFGAYVFDQSIVGGTNSVIFVPFEVWDIGLTPPGEENDPSDDERMIPALFADTGGTCAFDFDETTDTVGVDVYPATDRIYAYYALDGQSYADWEAFAEPLVAADPGGCPTIGATSTEAQAVYGGFADFARGRPIQRVVFLDAGLASPLGIVARFYTTDPVPPANEGGTGAAGYRLMPVYPNPLAQRAVVPFEVPRTGSVRLALYDVLGREVAVLVDGEVAVGPHTAPLNAAALPAGSYLVVFEAEGGVRLTQKVALLR